MKASQFRALIKEEVKKVLKESVMSDIDLMAQDAISFNAFAVTFFKEYGSDLPKEEKLAAIKWLKTVYKNAKENK
jgi:methionine synthase II (cobalamin-independent)